MFDILEVITSMDDILDEVQKENEGNICGHCIVEKLFARIKEYACQLEEEVAVIEDAWIESGYGNLMMQLDGGEPFEDIGSEDSKDKDPEDPNKNNKNNLN